MDLKVEHLPAMRLAAVAHRGPYHEIGPAFMRLGEIAGRAGLFAHPSAVMLGVYHDSPERTPPSQLRSHAAIAIPEGVAIPDGCVEVRLPARRYACHSHIGSYAGLGAAWSRLTPAALGSAGFAAEDAPALEIYRNDPGSTPEAELRTDLMVAIR